MTFLKIKNAKHFLKKQSSILKSTFSVGQGMENMLNRSGKKELHGKCVGLITPASALAVCARGCPVCTPVCVPLCARVCARSHRAPGPGLGAAGLPRGRGARAPVGPTRGRAQTRVAPALRVWVSPSAPFSASLGTGS